MKEYRQEPGGRRIKGDDLKVIQEIALLSEKHLSVYGNFVISGCEVGENTISSGIIMLDGKASTFGGAPEATFPYYVKKSVETENVAYESGAGTAIGYKIYEAIQAVASDAGAFRLDNAPRFSDVFKPKNAAHADTADNATNSVNATNSGNADTVDGQHFSWANSSDTPTYLWASNASGQSFLAARAQLNVKNADTVGNVALSGLLRQPINIPANADLNSYTTPGMYYCGMTLHAQTMTNIPYKEAFSLLVEMNAGVKQTFTIYPANNISTWVRSYYSGTWGSWYQTTMSDGSAVNADMVDRRHANDFMQVNYIASPNSIDNLSVNGLYTLTDNAGGTFPASTTKVGSTLLHFQYDVNAGYQLYFDYTKMKIWFREKVGNVFKAWQNIADGGAAATAGTLATARTIWGQSFNGSVNVSGNMTGVGNITTSNGAAISGPGAIEMFGSTPYIDFHHNNSTADYTSRIIEGLSGQLTITNSLRVAYAHNVSSSYRFHVGSGDSRFDNSISVGATVTADTVNSTKGFYQTSDERLKDNLRELNISLDDITSLPLFYFNLIEKPEKTEIGTSAQRLKEKFPELVSENEDGYYSVAYDKLAILALKGISLLAEKNEKYNERLKTIEQHLKINYNE